MGRSRFVPRGLMRTGVVFLLGVCALALTACGGLSDDELLVPGDANAVYEGGGGAGSYGPSSDDPSSYGIIAGKIRFQGRPYPSGKIDLGSKLDCASRRPNGLMSEEFLFAADGSLRGVVVYIKRGITSWPDAPTEPAVLDQIDCQYVPHVLIVRTGQELIVKSSDPFLHNVKAAVGPNASFNKAMSTIGQFSVTFTKTEVGKRFSCDVHGWMRSYVTVLPHPFHAISAEDGTFRIEGVPPGRYQLGVWHEKLGEMTLDISVGASETVTQDVTLER